MIYHFYEFFPINHHFKYPYLLIIITIQLFIIAINLFISYKFVLNSEPINIAIFIILSLNLICSIKPY